MHAFVYVTYRKRKRKRDQLILRNCSCSYADWQVPSLQSARQRTRRTDGVSSSMWSQLRARQKGYFSLLALLFYSGLRQIGWGPPTLGRVICLTQSADSGVHLIQKHSPRCTKNHAQLNVWAPWGPVELTHCTVPVWDVSSPGEWRSPSPQAAVALGISCSEWLPSMQFCGSSSHKAVHSAATLWSYLLSLSTSQTSPTPGLSESHRTEASSASLWLFESPVSHAALLPHSSGKVLLLIYR